MQGCMQNNKTGAIKWASIIMRKPAFCISKNKDADQLCGNREADLTAKLIRAFVFATRIVQSI